MARKKLIVISVVGICLFGLLATYCNSTYLSVTPPALGIPAIFTRNGQEVPPAQILSVKYSISENPPKSPSEIHTDSLREASNYDGIYYIIEAPFSIYHYGYYFSRTKIIPEYRSVFLRVAFADGKTFSLSFPIVSDTRENEPLYLDLSDVRR